jgi:hypothetical protein
MNKQHEEVAGTCIHLTQGPCFSPVEWIWALEFVTSALRQMEKKAHIRVFSLALGISAFFALVFLCAFTFLFCFAATFAKQ